METQEDSGLYYAWLRGQGLSDSQAIQRMREEKLYWRPTVKEPQSTYAETLGEWIRLTRSGLDAYETLRSMRGHDAHL